MNIHNIHTYISQLRLISPWIHLIYVAKSVRSNGIAHEAVPFPHWKRQRMKGNKKTFRNLGIRT